MIAPLWTFYWFLTLACLVWAVRLWVRVDRLTVENNILREVLEILQPEPIETVAVEEVELTIHPDWKVTKVGTLLPGQETDLL